MLRYKIFNGDAGKSERRDLPEVNLLIRLSESTDMQLEGKPVAEHVL